MPATNKATLIRHHILIKLVKTKLARSVTVIETDICGVFNIPTPGKISIL